MPKQKEPMRGEVCQTIAGVSVTILQKAGDGYKVLNENGKIEMVFPNQLMNQRDKPNDAK